MLTLMRLLARYLTPHPRPSYVVAYTFGLLMGAGFLIGSSPTLAVLLDQWLLNIWHVATILGSVIAGIGVIRGRARIEIAGLWLLLSALLVYATVLALAVRGASNPATIVGLVGLAGLTASMVVARIAVEIEALRAAARIDAVGL